MNQLFVYGSLQPGGPNEHVLAPLGGSFQPGYVLGHLREEGWGATLGYPGLVLSDNGERISGQLFSSPNLKEHWPMLDEFEGSAYQRVKTRVQLESGTSTDAYVYTLRER